MRTALSAAERTGRADPDGRALLARIGRAPDALAEDDLEAHDREARVAAEQHLWSWYLEWSSLARIAIRDRRLLRSLGFRRGTRGSEGERE